MRLHKGTIFSLDARNQFQTDRSSADNLTSTQQSDDDISQRLFS